MESENAGFLALDSGFRRNADFLNGMKTFTRRINNSEGVVPWLVVEP